MVDTIEGDDGDGSSAACADTVNGDYAGKRVREILLTSNLSKWNSDMPNRYRIITHELEHSIGLGHLDNGPDGASNGETFEDSLLLRPFKAMMASGGADERVSFTVTNHDKWNIIKMERNR